MTRITLGRNGPRVGLKEKKQKKREETALLRSIKLLLCIRCKSVMEMEFLFKKIYKKRERGRRKKKEKHVE